MYPLLILREEFVCLVLLLFLAAMSRTYRMGKDSHTFNKLTLLAILHVIMDIVTVWTVNHRDSVPPIINEACHIVFYMTAIFYANEIFAYVTALCYPDKSKKLYPFGFVLPVLYMLLLPLFPIQYIDVNGTASSTGPAAYIGYSIAFAYFLSALALILINRQKLPAVILRSLLPMMAVLVLGEAAQVAVRELLLTGGCITVVTVGFFFSLENPAHVFERKAMTDALTGVQSRHSYDRYMEQHAPEFHANPSTDYTFVYCDINGLRTVNNTYGHAEGDEYITRIAVILLRSLVHAEGIYRMGGDEFLAIYHRIDQKTVDRELQKVLELCESTENPKGYRLSVATGYAVSSPEQKELSEAIKAADFMMYRNKTLMKEGMTFVNAGNGTSLNLTGLTDRVFDAMCTTNERSYPFLTNLETNVTRISPAWAAYFGLSEEFMDNFNEIWTPHIHPDDRKTFTDDITATLSGRKKYHNCQYRALRPDGEYVLCTCHGSVYHGKDGEADIFAGYMENHGVEDRVDRITGLPNFAALDLITPGILHSRDKAAILKLSINNIGRINMLYGYDNGSLVLKRLGEMISELCEGQAELFCQDACNFSLLMRNEQADLTESLYRQIQDMCERGVLLNDTRIPVSISGGSVVMPSDSINDRNALRQALICALDESRFSEHNKLVFFESTRIPADAFDFKLMSMIHRDAVGDRVNFRLRYQPIVETGSGNVIGAEALLRWMSPEEGEISPARFIGFLENDTCYYQLGLFILRKALTDAQQFRIKIPNFRINVNITSLQLQDDGFLQDVLKILKETAYPPDGLMLELTERCKEMDIEELRNRINAFRQQRIGIALDDMGTGYSTLSLLMDIDVDEIKLDRDFVTGVESNSDRQIFVRALFSGMQYQNFYVCFEGVEKESTLRHLQNYGPSLSQGYLFARPLTSSGFLEFINR